MIVWHGVYYYEFSNTAVDDFTFNTQVFSFTSEQTSISIGGQIVDDALLEDSEFFFGNLTVVSNEFPRLIVANNGTRITIEDDDGEH